MGRDRDVTAEFVTLTGTKMGEAAAYRVIVDRISHEVEYYRAYLKHAVLEGTYVINNPFWWTADDKFFNYSIAKKIGVAVPKTVLLPQKSYPADIDLTSESLHNLGYPIDWDGLLDYVGRPAILKPYSGGGWKHVYKVHDRAELLAAYDGTGPYCMTLQEFIDFDKYVRCFTFGQTDIVPVAYDPRERRYLVDHAYLSADLGARIVRDAQTIEYRARLRDEHHRVRRPGRRPLRHRLPEPGTRLRARPHHRPLLRDRRREDGGARHRSGAERARPADVAALGRYGRPVRECERSPPDQDRCDGRPPGNKVVSTDKTPSTTGVSSCRRPTGRLRVPAWRSGCASSA